MQENALTDQSARTVSLPGRDTLDRALISLSRERSPPASHSELSILQDPAPGDENAAWLPRLHLDSLRHSPDGRLAAPQV